MKDSRIYDLIPHREPMLLIDRIIDLGDNFSKTEITITAESSFFEEGKGVPAWIGIEYMGQTAALIAGYQLQQGKVTPHLGLLLGTRKYQTNTAWFAEGEQLQITCTEIAVVGNQLANFLCEIYRQSDHFLYASAKLSVFRKPLDEVQNPS